MKVTHIIDSGGYYGAEVMLVHLCQAQQKAGLQVEVISIGTPDDGRKPLEQKLDQLQIPFTPWRMRALPDVRESLKIMDYCKTSNTNIIHSHGYKGNILLAMLSKKKRCLPVIATVHGYTAPKTFSKMALYQIFDRLCLSLLDGVVVVSAGMVHQVNSKKLGKKLTVISNGIPTTISDAAEEPINALSSKHHIIASIGRLSLEKNFQFLINLMPQIQAQIPDAKLVIFGEGPERENLQRLIEILNLKNSVELAGYIDEPSRVYRQTDVFVNCSLTEGMPITLLEALREGCKILASAIEANKAVLNISVESVKTAKLDDEEFVTQLISLLSNKNDQSEIVKHFFSENFTVEAMEKKYRNLYQRVTKS